MKVFCHRKLSYLLYLNKAFTKSERRFFVIENFVIYSTLFKGTVTQLTSYDLPLSRWVFF
jgi:hypothetical protein